MHNWLLEHLPLHSSFRQPEALLVIDTDGPCEWSCSDWKLLDACFTDMRLKVGVQWGHEGLLGDVDVVLVLDCCLAHLNYLVYSQCT